MRQGGFVVFATTLAVCAAIGILAAAFSVPLAWVAAHVAGPRARAMAFAWMLVPLLLPSYLWYAGVSAARGPGTWLGGVLERSPQWVNIGTGRGLAIVGVAVHLMPLAGAVLVAGFGALPASTLDLLKLDARGPLARGLMIARLSRGALAAAAATCGLVAIGSAVPLHLAQVNTYAIELWRRMDLCAPGETGPVLLAALPLLGVAMFAAVALANGVWHARRGGGVEAPEGRHSGVGAAAGAAAVMVAAGATLVPLALLAASLRGVEVVRQFVRDSGAAVADSLLVAGATGMIAMVLAAGVWATLAARPLGRSRVVWCVRVILAGGLALALVPGAVVGWLLRLGSARVGEVWPWLDDLVATTHAGLVAGHVLRFGGMALVMGVLAAGSEAPALRELRASEGATGPRAWWRLCGRPGWRVLAGTGLGVASLSMFEIEASVMLQAPGTRSLARTLLEHLHTLRDQQLAAGAVVLVSCGVLVALAAGWMAGTVLGRGRG